VAEVSIHVAAAVRGKGAGKALLQALIAQSESCGIWTLQAEIFPENEASSCPAQSLRFPRSRHQTANWEVERQMA